MVLRKEQPERPFDLQALALLMRTILLRNYQYWLSEEDPLPWFEKQCGDYCRQWHGQDLLQGISHQRIRECQQIQEAVDFAADYQAGLELILTLPSTYGHRPSLQGNPRQDGGSGAG